MVNPIYFFNVQEDAVKNKITVQGKLDAKPN